MDKFKLILKILISFFFFIISSSVIIQWLVTVPNPLGLGFITPESQDTWINFFGAVIGGGVTLVGVWWTIKNQEEQRRNDLAIQYRPIIIFNNDDFQANEQADQQIIFHLKLLNVGRGEAMNIKVNIENLEGLDICFKEGINILVKDAKINYRIPILKKYNYFETSSKTFLDYSVAKKEYDNEGNFLIYKNFPMKQCVLNPIITYEDLFGNKYKSTILINFQRNINPLRKFTSDPTYFGVWECKIDLLSIEKI